MRAKIAYWVMKYKGLVSLLFLAITIGFMFGIPKVDIRTVFLDLLPEDDPYVQVYFDNKNFGNPMMIAITVSYTHLTLPRYAVCRSRWSPYH